MTAQETIGIMADVRYVAYLSKQDLGSAKFREYFNRLPSDQKRLVRIFDYERTRLSGDVLPRWLNGAPIMATYEANPQVWKGKSLIEMMENWVQSMQQYTRPTAVAQQSRKFIADEPVCGHHSRGSNPAEADMQTISQSPNLGIMFGRGAQVISDTLYEGRRATTSDLGPSGKISSADLDAYMAKRAACPAVQRRQAMGGGARGGGPPGSF